MDKSHVGMTRCFYCGEHDKILLDKRLRGTLPRDCGVVDMEPCAKCEDYMKQGIMLIEINEPKDGKIPIHELTDRRGNIVQKIPNPDRTGRMSVIREEAYNNIFVGEAGELGRKYRWTFVSKEVGDQVGCFPEPEEIES